MISKSVLALMILTASTWARATPLSERLGYGPEEKLVLFHMDDLGLSEATNRAASEAAAFGLAKSGSVMLVAPFANQTKTIFDGPGDLGIHLILNGQGGWRPLTPIDLIPTLAEPGGLLQRNFPHLALVTTTADVTREMEAQIQAGLAICTSCMTHIDSHMGTVFMRPAWLNAYLELSRKYRLVPMVPRWTGGMELMLKPLGSRMTAMIGRFVKPLIKQVEARGFLPLDDYYILRLMDENYDERKAKYLSIIRNLKPGVTEIVFHPSYLDTNTETSRYLDAQMLKDPEIAAELKTVGAKTIGFREIQERYPWDQITYEVSKEPRVHHDPAGSSPAIF